MKKEINSILGINKKDKLVHENLKICLIYLFIGFLWILFSDGIVRQFVNDSDMILIISTYKGWIYVIVTSIMLYILINNYVTKLNLNQNKLNESYEDLSAVNQELEAYVQQLTASEQVLRNQYDKIIESEEQYKILVNEMQQGLAIYDVVANDKDEIIEYIFVYGNKNHEKITGFNNVDLLGKPLSKIFTSIEADLIEKYGQVVKTGEPFSYENHLEETGRDYNVIVYRPKQLQIAVIVNDITEKKEIQDALKASEYNFRNIFEASSDGILILGNNKVVDCNLAMVDLIGYDSKASLIGKNIIDLAPEKQLDGELSQEKVSKVYENISKNGSYKFEWWYKRVDGKIFPVEIMMTNIMLNGRIVFHSLWRDISERKQMESKMEYLSYHDQLTGLYNRRFFEEELIRLDEEKYLPLTIIMGDVNGLKLVNDSFGHIMGDNLLKKVAGVMKAGCRSNDIVARLGGDEFVILLPNTGNIKAKEIIKRIKSLASKETIDYVEISVSFGYETKNTAKEKIEEILKKADDRMYEKKLSESQNMRRKTIYAIITTLNGKDKRMEAQSHEVSELCKSMAIALNLPKDEINDLQIAADLRDIGKICIDDKILNKPGKLTNEEWEEVKHYPEIGYRIISTVNSMSQIAGYVLAYHEKWNGTGYPRQLKGEEIPLQSRILTIAGSYGAMTRERSYSKALTKEEAIKELKVNSGTQFDPILVSIFVEKVLKYPF